MKRSTAYLILILILVLFGSVDYFLLTSSASVSRVARGELESLFGDTLKYEKITASYFDEILVLEQADFFATPERLKVLSVDRAEIQFQDGIGKRLDRIYLNRPRLTLSKILFEELEKLPSGKSFREEVDVKSLPSVYCEGGTVELIHEDIFRWDRPQAFSIETLSLVPSVGTVYLIHGKLESPLLGRWVLQGSYHLKTEEFHIQMECDSLSFGGELRDQLHSDHHSAWDRYSPEGNAGIHISWRQKSEGVSDFQVSVKPAGMALTYAKFPYPMKQIEGELVFRGDGFQIRHLEAQNGSALVSFDGRAGGYGSEADFRFRLRIRDMPLDKTLRNSLDKKGRSIWDSFQATGWIDVDGWIERDRGPEKPVRTPMDIRFRDSCLQYKGFPYPVENLKGFIRVDLPRVSILHVETNEPRWKISSLGLIPDEASKFLISGWIDDLDKEASVNLHIKGHSIPLDTRLRDALGKTGVDLWKRLRPKGFVDLDWHVRKLGQEEVVHSGVARLLGCDVTYDEVPLPLTDVTGEVRYRPEKIDLHALRGMSGKAEVTVEGSLVDAMARIGVRMVGLPLRPETVSTLPSDVQDILRALKLEGTVNTDVNLKIYHGETRKMDGWVSLQINDGSIRGEIPIDHILGDARLEVYVRGDKTELRGPLRLMQATVMKKEIQRVSCSMTKTGSVLRFLNIQGAVYEGGLGGWMKLDLESDEYSGDLQVSNMDLASFSRSTETFATSEPPEGKVDIEIKGLTGVGSDAASLRGKGKITISQGKLGRIPIFAGIFSLDPTKWGGNPVFDAGSIYFDLADRKVQIHTLGFEGKGSSILGKGSVDFDGNLDLKLRMESGGLFGIDFFLFRIPVQIVDFLRNAILPIKVTGTLEKPEVNE